MSESKERFEYRLDGGTLYARILPARERMGFGGGSNPPSIVLEYVEDNGKSRKARLWLEKGQLHYTGEPPLGYSRAGPAKPEMEGAVPLRLASKELGLPREVMKAYVRDVSEWHHLEEGRRRPNRGFIAALLLLAVVAGTALFRGSTGEFVAGSTIGPAALFAAGLLAAVWALRRLR